ASRRRTRRSILDFVATEMTSMKRTLGADDRGRVDRYLEDIREVERRLQLMFDLQVLAFSADITRVFSFKMGRDGSSRVYPESGSDKPFHPASHHGGNEKGVKEFQLI